MNEEEEEEKVEKEEGKRGRRKNMGNSAPLYFNSRSAPVDEMLCLLFGRRLTLKIPL